MEAELLVMVKRGKKTDMSCLRGIGAEFDIAMTILLCALVGYYICGGEHSGVTPLSIVGLVVGALFGLVVAIYRIIRVFGDVTEGKKEVKK